MTEAEMIKIIEDEDLMGDEIADVGYTPSDYDVVSCLSERGWPDSERWLKLFNALHGDGSSRTFLTPELRRKAIAYLRAGEEFPSHLDRLVI